MLLEEPKKKDLYDLVSAPEINPDFTYSFPGTHREIRVYREVNDRMTLEDFYAKLALNFPTPEA